MFGKKKAKKKKQKPEVFVSLSANGVEVEAINFTLKKGPEGEPLLEVRTKDVCEPLHFSEVNFELKTTLKMVRVRGSFREAVNERQLKLYVFNVEDYAQFFI